MLDAVQLQKRGHCIRSLAHQRGQLRLIGRADLGRYPYPICLLQCLLVILLLAMPHASFQLSLEGVLLFVRLRQRPVMLLIQLDPSYEDASPPYPSIHIPPEPAGRPMAHGNAPSSPSFPGQALARTFLTLETGGRCGGCGWCRDEYQRLEREHAVQEEEQAAHCSAL